MSVSSAVLVIGRDPYNGQSRRTVDQERAARLLPATREWGSEPESRVNRRVKTVTVWNGVSQYVVSLSPKVSCLEAQHRIREIQTERDVTLRS